MLLDFFEIIFVKDLDVWCPSLKWLIHWRWLKKFVDHFLLLLVELVQGTNHCLVGVECGLLRVLLHDLDLLLLELLWGDDGSTADIPDVSQVLAGNMASIFILLVATVVVEAGVDSTSLLMGEFLVLVDLLSDRVSNWEHEFGAKSKVGAETLGEVLR